MLLAAGVATMMWALAAQRAAPQAGPDADETLPVSAERVRQGLQRAPLKIPPVDAAADFRITVEVHGFPIETVLEAVRRELSAQPRRLNPAQRTFMGTQPLIVSPNMIDVAATLVKRIKAARRARAERVTRQEIAEEFAAFCAEHDCSVVESGPDPREGILLIEK